MTAIRFVFLFLMGGLLLDVCTSAKMRSCMKKWLLLSGIPEGPASQYEQTLALLKVDELTYRRTHPLIYRLLFTRSHKHTARFLNCIGKVTGRCKARPPCANGGLCLHNPNSPTFNCQCKKGFAGLFCKTELNGCNSNPCQHGGRCQNNLGYFKCQCLTGYEGQRCEKHWLDPKRYKPLPDKLAKLSFDLKKSVTAVDLKKSMTAFEKKVEADIMSKIKPMAGKIKQQGQTISNIGNMYTRWGHNRCPRTSQLVYSGFMAGPKYEHRGSGANHLCFPFKPIYVPGTGTAGAAYIYGSEYQSANQVNSRKLNIETKNIPCAVCQVNKRSKTFMMPARNVCPRGWVREYHGYLMAGDYTHYKANYICMDQEMRTLRDSTSNRNSNILYTVRVGCNAGIKCGPYKDGPPLTCAFCSK